MSRIVGLSSVRLDTLIDGIYAIAMTLLVLEVRVPEGLNAAELPQRLAQVAPHLLSYLISFALLGVFWMSHHFAASLVRCTDFMHTLLNLMALLLVALLPFTSALLGAYPHVPLAPVTFGAHVALVSLLYALNWRHCLNVHLTRDGLPLSLARRIQGMAWEATLGFLLMVPLAYVAASWSLLWYAVLIPFALVQLARMERAFMTRKNFRGAEGVDFGPAA